VLKNFMHSYAGKIKLAVLLLTVCILGVPDGRIVKAANERKGPALAAPRTPANVILITISTLRADHLSCMGYNRHTTAALDSFARRNILFRNAFAVSGWMMPAHGSIFTSLYPARHGATHIDRSLDDGHCTLAEILQDNGYYCAAFCCNPRLDSNHGFAQGFHLYDDYSASIMLETMAFGMSDNLDINKQRTNDLINDAAIRWLQNNTHRPFFMFVHYYDNHWDYLPPPPYDKLYDPNYDGPIDGAEIPREPLYSNPPDQRDIEHIIALYDGEVKQTDSDLGRMLDFLHSKGLLDNSIVVIAGDHGEQFYEHGHTSHQGLFEELIHIPLAISIPDEKAKGRTIDSLVSQVDILPTILDVLQIPAPATCQGKSLKPLIEKKVESVNEFVFAEYTAGAVPDSYVVRSLRYKCYETAGEQFAYDLLKDPAEQHRIFPPYFSEEVKELQRILNRRMQENNKQRLTE
jgi:arylsulfatase A-like enzyme